MSENCSGQIDWPFQVPNWVWRPMDWISRKRGRNGGMTRHTRTCWRAALLLGRLASLTVAGNTVLSYLPSRSQERKPPPGFSPERPAARSQKWSLLLNLMYLGVGITLDLLGNPVRCAFQGRGWGLDPHLLPVNFLTLWGQSSPLLSTSEEALLAQHESLRVMVDSLLLSL